MSELKLAKHQIELPSRKSRLETYFWDSTDEVSDEIAADFYRPEKPVASTAVLVPVALHQDLGHVDTALSLYDQQTGAEPFTIFLSFNSPAEVEQRYLDACAREVASFADDYPDLDIRHTIQLYDPPIIGQVRKDLWDGALKTAYCDGVFDEPISEVIGINHDIDSVTMSPNYIQSIQRHYKKQQADQSRDGFAQDVMNPAASNTRLEIPASHPNTAKGIFWQQAIYHQYFNSTGSGYDAGMIMPFSYYAKKGGFAKTRTYETKPLVPTSLGTLSKIQASKLVTSSRRQIDRFPDNGYNIWTDESFSATDNCRSQPLEMLRDATTDELSEHIFDNLDSHADVLVAAGVVKSPRMLDDSTYIKSLHDRSSDTKAVALDLYSARVERQRRFGQRALQIIKQPNYMIDLFNQAVDEKKVFHGAAVEKAASRDLANAKFAVKSFAD